MGGQKGKSPDWRQQGPKVRVMEKDVGFQRQPDVGSEAAIHSKSVTAHWSRGPRAENVGAEHDTEALWNHIVIGREDIPKTDEAAVPKEQWRDKKRECRMSGERKWETFPGRISKVSE